MKASYKSAVITLSGMLFMLFTITYCLAADNTEAVVDATAGLHGTVYDVEEETIAGAMIFIYNSADVWREANFISAPTGNDGVYKIVVPPGKYWVVARLKKAKPEEFGPLMPKDRHSGDPVEIELAAEVKEHMDFTVADLMEAIKMKRETMERPIKITGRILDEKGDPLTNAYAIAHKKIDIPRVPDYLSAWVGKDGTYTLYVPEGTYYIGGAETFPPGKDYFLNEKISFDTDTLSLDIVKKTHENR